MHDGIYVIVKTHGAGIEASYRHEGQALDLFVAADGKLVFEGMSARDLEAFGYQILNAADIRRNYEAKEDARALAASGPAPF